MEEILEGHVRRKALLPKSKPTLFLYEGDSQKHSKMIGNVRYVTVSHYSGDKNIFEKVGELITRDFHSAEPDKVTNEISVGLSMDISEDRKAMGIVCLNKTKRRTPNGTGKRSDLLPLESG